MATSYGWWVQARSTCSPQQWTVDRSESVYEVKVRDFSASGFAYVYYLLLTTLLLATHCLLLITHHSVLTAYC